MQALSEHKLYGKTLKIVWALFFVTLPVTSFPYFPGGLGGKTLVRPLGLYPLILLIILATLPRLLSKPLPKTLLPFFSFLILAIVSSVVAFTAELEALRGVSMGERFLRNMITLGVGSAFYLTITLLPENWADLKYSLRWLYIGFGIALLWGTLQSIYVIHYSPQYFKWMGNIQSIFSTRKLFPTRISGMTYEPKWFAEQICFVLLPWLLGAVLTKYSPFTWKIHTPIGKITIEWLLLAWASVILIFTYSRTGLSILVLLIVISFLLARFYFPFKFPKQGKSSATNPTLRRRRWLELSLIIIGLLTVIIVFGSQNPYFSRFWRYWTEAKSRNRTYLEYIGFQQRFAYVETAMRIYEEYPLLGVGLGNYAFYFDEMLPDRPWFQQPEIVRQITPVEGRNTLITSKNLLARLLAETGLAGTITFTAFILALVGCILFLWYSPKVEQRYWGVSGFLGMIVFALIILSFDSFALPNMWVLFGFVTAAAHIKE